MSAADPLARVRQIALALPDAAEKLSHGMPGFYVMKGRFFAYFWHNHHGDGRLAVVVKTGGRDEQAMLMEIDPDSYFIPPYLGPSGWIGIHLSGDAVDWARVEDRIAMSWRLAAPPRLLARVDAAD
ncbi:MmcQ/YjbR family DNA-binding protein [Sphingomonas sp.]|uniref:MmcQ/YjbR family DNA-binding protein n=1 Tax=Sphingomonas sp. TaxID=28214 RepID=UPI001D7ECABA|nr:MmcQ/YjbR family DNA-binding protein [Sphingomonas sp.]MBX9796753.1 MmcQ/YjbR family DNA-binding protein [Sphingomonas sp.]